MQQAQLHSRDRCTASLVKAALLCERQEWWMYEALPYLDLSQQKMDWQLLIPFAGGKEFLCQPQIGWVIGMFFTFPSVCSHVCSIGRLYLSSCVLGGKRIRKFGKVKSFWVQYQRYGRRWSIQLKLVQFYRALMTVHLTRFHLSITLHDFENGACYN